MDFLTEEKVRIETIRKSRAMELALGEAYKYGITSIVLTTGLVVIANRRSSWFQKFMSLSAKTSLPVMTSMFLFGLKYEHTLSDTMRLVECCICVYYYFLLCFTFSS